jgi:hypothetical protein
MKNPPENEKFTVSLEKSLAAIVRISQLSKDKRRGRQANHWVYGRRE